MKELGAQRYLLIILTAILTVNYIDRLALGILLQDIKAEFRLSDTQLGLLSGLAFAFFYSIMGIPIARLSDRGNRVAIISISTALWSAALALSAAAASFAQLLMIRVAVAIGEAGCMPPSHSLIADYFNPSQRPRAMSRYLLGAPLSVVIGFFAAGWLNQYFGWRWTFVLLGLPGVPLAALAWLTLREPRAALKARPAARDGASGLALQRAEKPEGLLQTCHALWLNRTFRHLLLYYAIVSFFGAGVFQWQPSYFMRRYGMQSGELGTLLALANGLGGLLGIYLGGEWAARYAAGDVRRQLKAMSAAVAAFGLVWPLIYLAPNEYVAFGLMGLAIVGGALVNGPLFALIQTLVEPRSRAVSIALFYLFANLIGAGLGPLLAGAISDALRPWAGEDSLRAALLILCPGYLWGAWHIWKAIGTVESDVARTSEEGTRLGGTSGVAPLSPGAP